MRPERFGQIRDQHTYHGTVYKRQTVELSAALIFP
jgi:hypothetical protein